MRLNELTISTFESEYIKNYLTNIKHEFTLDEMITIILNSGMSLSTKIRVLDSFYNDAEIDGYRCNSDIILNDELDSIIYDLKYALECLNGNHNSIITFTDKFDLTHSVFNIEIARSAISNMNDGTHSVTIVDGLTGYDVAYVSLDDCLNPVNVSFIDGYDKSILWDKYIDIPNDITIGDIVTIHNSAEEYVVVYDSKLPKNLWDKSDYSVDACITVCPKEVLDADRDYKEQIEEILAKRIQNVENNNTELDIIQVNHEHLHISFVEKRTNE